MTGSQLDPDLIKKDFPLFAHYPELVYLDSGATSQKPETVLNAMDDFYRTGNANVHRGLYQLAGEATGRYNRARQTIAAFLNASSDREIVFTHGTTEGINLAANSYARQNLKKGDIILLSEMEHHSNLVPWQMLAKDIGVELQFIPFDDHGELELDAIQWSSKIGMVSIAHVSNVFGTINPVKEIIRKAHQIGAVVLIDGAQSAAHMKIDVQDLDCDFFALSGHKMYGPTGIGVLYAKSEILEQMVPFLGGGDMISAVWLEKAAWNEIPYRFEAGTQPLAESIGLGAACDYLLELEMNRIAQTEEELSRYTRTSLSSINGITLYGPEKNFGPVFSFNIDGIHPHDTAQFLDSCNIAVRAGHHCAHPVMRKLNIPATARVSLGIYNTQKDIDHLVLGIEKTKEFFK